MNRNPYISLYPAYSFHASNVFRKIRNVHGHVFGDGVVLWAARVSLSLRVSCTASDCIRDKTKEFRYKRKDDLNKHKVRGKHLWRKHAETVNVFSAFSRKNCSCSSMQLTGDFVIERWKRNACHTFVIFILMESFLWKIPHFCKHVANHAVLAQQEKNGEKTKARNSGCGILQNQDRKFIMLQTPRDKV